MNPLKVLQNVSFRNLLKVLLIAIKHPLFLWPTFKATRQTVSLSYAHYGKAHHKNGPANAFRHALWNYLIALKCTRWNRQKEKCAQWAKTITDWHENAFPNKKLARIMDFHNNAVGRMLFLQKDSLNFEEMVAFLLKMTKTSILIDEDTDLTPFKEKLVHITDHVER